MGKSALWLFAIVGLAVVACSGDGVPLPPDAGTDCDVDECASTWEPCVNALDCDSRGGYTCSLDRFLASARPDAGEAPPADAAVVASYSRPSYGTCSETCESSLCVDPSHVCSSSSGFCRPGCDAEKNACPGGRACDLSSRRCVSTDGRCTERADCGVYDARLATFGEVSCASGACAFVNRPAEQAVAVPNASGFGGIGVHSPNAGTRIDAATLEGFRFQFDVPASVMVAAILRRRPLGIYDANDAAIWAAYLSEAQASAGVTLSQGGSLYGAELVSSATRLNQTLYFLVLGFTEGELVATSEAIPFSIGTPFLRSGDPCELPNDALCPAALPLVCVDGFCRTPCFTESDCIPESKSCAPPFWRGITARVCL